jgi:hypothetical protein
MNNQLIFTIDLNFTLHMLIKLNINISLYLYQTNHHFVLILIVINNWLKF